jgi:Fe-S cluster assembly protein SufD
MSLDRTFFSQYYERRWASAAQPSWSADSYARFCAKGLPTRKSEAWRYAKLDQWFSPSRQAACMEDSLVACADRPVEADILVANGKVTVLNPDLDITVLPLQEALQSHAEMVERHMQRYLGHDRLDNPFAHYAAATWQDGVFIQVLPGYRRQVPLRIVYDYTSGVFANLLHIVDMGIGSKLTLLEYSYGADTASYIHNSFSSIQLGTGAELVNERVQMASEQAVWHDCRLVHQDNTSQCTQRLFTLGGQHAREETLVDFIGEQAEHHFSGVGFAGPQAAHGVHVMMLHRADHCRSDQQYRALVAQRAENSFLGHIVVPKGVQATTAYQDSKSLLLDVLARANVKPYLEIFADDVVCTHSAAVGQLDKKALFYLQARGMTAAQAYAILLDAFVQETLSTCVDDRIRQQVAAAVETRSRLISGEMTL